MLDQVADTDNGKRWACDAGSPCDRIIPSVRDTIPNLYFLVEFSTAEVNSNHSYCTYRNRYIIRLYGLPVNFAYTVATTAGTLGFLVFCLMILLARKYYEQKAANLENARQGQVAPEQVPVEEAIDLGPKPEFDVSFAASRRRAAPSHMSRPESVIEEARFALEHQKSAAYNLGLQQQQEEDMESDDDVDVAAFLRRRDPIVQEEALMENPEVDEE